MITIISLGTERGEITSAAQEALNAAKRVIVRNFSPVAEALSIDYVTLDSVYAKSRSFASLAKNLAAEVRRQEAEYGDVCYCVEGGVFEDRAAGLLIKKGGVRVLEGVSKSAKAASLAGITGGYTAVSAYELAEKKIAFPLVVYDLDDRLLAGDIKLLLSERCGDEAKALFVHGREKKEIRLYEADRQEVYDENCCLVVAEIPLLEKTRFDFEDFIAILKRLRAPDGCPWDRVQTHESIRINAIEEAYELVDAIDLSDPDKMCEEAGDVLMQAAFHALIEEEKGSFSVSDMLSGVCEKLISRHTHVFGTDKAKNADGALSVWEKNKMTEKHQTTFSDAIQDIPEGFPALLKAQKFAKRAAKGGWNFCGAAQSRASMEEKAAELFKAAKSGDKSAVQEKLGELLLSAAWLAHAVGGDAEMALLDAVKKNKKRYKAWEELVLADGKDVNALTDGERKDYYERAEESLKNED